MEDKELKARPDSGKFKITVPEYIAGSLRVDRDLIVNDMKLDGCEYHFSFIMHDSEMDIDKGLIDTDVNARIIGRLPETFKAMKDDIEGFRDETVKVPIFHTNEYVNMVFASKHINTPKFTKPKYYGELLDFMEVGSKYVIKRFNMARGLGKMHFDPSNYDHCRMMRAFYNGNPDKAKSLLTPCHPSAMNYKDEDKDIDDMNKDNTFVMEDIGFEKIQEFRVIVFKTKAYCIKLRTGYHPLSGGARVDEPLSVVDSHIIPPSDLEMIINKFHAILEEAHAPYGSFDLYVKEDESDFDKRYGIFEWSNQFAFSFSLKVIKMIRRQYTISLIEYILEQLNYKSKVDFKNTKPYMLK